MKKYYLEVLLCLFSLKTIIYAMLLSAMVLENHAVFWGKILISKGGGGINIRFLPKHRPLMFCFIGRQATDSERAGESEVRVPEDQRVEDLSPGHRHG